MDSYTLTSAWITLGLCCPLNFFQPLLFFHLTANSLSFLSILLSLFLLRFFFTFFLFLLLQKPPALCTR